MWQREGTMSAIVGRLKHFKFMSTSACMAQTERETLAILEYLKGVIDEPDFVELLDKWIIPFIKKRGQAKWSRDVITDLGFAQASAKRRTSSEKGVLEFEPK